MTEADAGLLVGRDHDANKFTDDVLSHNLVILTGESGVGKSSLLNVGLVRQLRVDGFEAMVCNDWSSSIDSLENPEAFIAEKVRNQLPVGIDLDRPGAPGLCAQLDAEYGESAVLVLDQFEELIRYQPELFYRIWDWIIRISKMHRTRVVLSLRSEYEHRLRGLDSKVGPFKMARYVLRPLRKLSDVEAVMSSADRPDKPAITAEAVADLMSAWQSARGGQPWSEIGLLHLQATLYVLYARAGRGTVQRSDVARLIADADERADGQLFAMGLTEAVGLKLDRCVEACSAPELEEPLDDVLVTGTRSLIKRVVGQLSSGGYKIVREQWDLAQKVLRRELELLEWTPGEPEQIFHVLAGLVVGGTNRDDLLSVTRRSVEATFGEAVEPLDAVESQDAVEAQDTDSYLASLGLDPVPWEADPEDTSSGPMIGMSSRAVLIEEMRRFFFALVWLREASLLRRTSPASEQTMLSLIHDGFASGLEDWASDPIVQPAEALSLLTAANGESYVWQRDRSDQPEFAEFDGATGFRTIANVRWRYCRISASFRRVVFVNCDFRGSRFEWCGFSGVVFMNCLLDGVIFGECTVYGEVTPPFEHSAWRLQSSELPSFVVEDAEDLVRTLNVYRNTTSTSAELFSVTSGVPAVPRAGDVKGDVSWRPQAGGLTMYGGRLSSLMVRRCRFESSGTLALRHIAGSSLELADQSTGHIEIYGGAIRGLSITRPVDDADLEAGDITLDVRDSVIANVWFGGGLTGSASFTGSALWQLVNTSDRAEFEVAINICAYYGLVNVRPPVGSSEETGFALDSFEARGMVVKSGTRMDYRRVPARLELKARENRPR